MKEDDRNARQKQTPVDLSVPLNLDTFKVTEDDCFGRLWDAKDKTCMTCADQEICGSIFLRVTQKTKEKEIEKKQNSKFLDMVNFDRIPKDQLYEEIKEKSGKLKSEDLIKFVKYYSRCDDQASIIAWLKNFKLEYNVKIKEGVVYVG